MIRNSRWPSARRCSAALRAPAQVVHFDRPVFGERGGVDKHDREAGPSDLLDLRVVLGQTEGDETVHCGPAHGAGERALEGRDEEDAVAEVLGGVGDAFTEGPEERVREDDGQGLGGSGPRSSSSDPG